MVTDNGGPGAGLSTSLSKALLAICDTKRKWAEANIAHEAECGPPVLLALVRFLAKYQSDLNALRDRCMSMTPEDCKDAIIMQWPVIQGTANQIALKRIGELDYDIELVAKAVNAMRANNPPAKNKGGE